MPKIKDKKTTMPKIRDKKAAMPKIKDKKVTLPKMSLILLPPGLSAASLLSGLLVIFCQNP